MTQGVFFCLVIATGAGSGYRLRMTNTDRLTTEGAALGIFTALVFAAFLLVAVVH